MFPRASEEDAIKGWRLLPDMLEEVRIKMWGAGWRPTRKEIEDILLAAESAMIPSERRSNYGRGNMPSRPESSVLTQR